MSFKQCVILPIFFLATAFSFADPIHSDPDVEKAILRANELFLNADFDGGISVIRQLENSHGDHPGVAYFTANGYWWKLFQIYVYDKEARDEQIEGYFDYFVNQTIEKSEKCLKKNEKDVLGLFYLGNAHSLRSRLKGLHGSYFSAGREAAKGKGYLEKVMEIDPNQHDAYYNLGVYNYLAGTLPGYAKVLKVFLFLPGGTKEKGLSLLKVAGKKSVYFGPEAQLILARFYADFEDQPQEAVKIVEGFHSRYPDNPWFHFWRGTLYSDELNQYEIAGEIYDQVLDRCNRGVPGYGVDVKNQAWLKLARVYSRQLEPERAIDEIKELIATKPNKPSWILPRAYLEMGNIYDQIGMRREAIAAYTQVLSFEDYRDFHEQSKRLRTKKYNQKLADIYRMNLEGRRLAADGRFAEADASFHEVLKKYPDNDQTLYCIGEMLYLRGSYTEAAELLRKVLKRNPKEPNWLVPGIYVRLGQIHQANEEQEAARRSFEKALEEKTIASDDRNLAKRALRQIAQGKSS